jgi:glycosyltransferase involved in cell wall biosynthesis
MAEDTFQFVLMGDGPEKSALMRYAEDRCIRNVRFLPSRPSGEIPPYVASADVILITLKKHIPGAVPSKIYEAMASARPIILVAEGEAADIVREHEAGLVVQPGDIGGLVDALRSLHNQPELRERLGKNGRQAAETHFNRDLIAARFINLLERNL